MKVIENTLKPVLDRWSDPGDYPSGAGGGPLASYDYVEYIDGAITVELDAEDMKALADFADVDMTETKMYEAYFKDNAADVPHDVSGLTVQKWEVERIAGNRVTLTVEEFEAEAPEPPEPEYDPMDEIERRERRDKFLD
jgi:hypothetical protein